MKNVFVLACITLVSYYASAQPNLYALTGTSGDNFISKYVAGSNTTSAAHVFESKGSNPQYSELVEHPNGKLYGLMPNGGKYGGGVLYSIDPNINNSYTILKHFNGNLDGNQPYGSLVIAPDGKLYGITSTGGSNFSGVIFSFNPATNQYTKIKEFLNSESSFTFGSLTFSDDGNLYGMSSSGGANGLGAIFRINVLNSNFTKLYDLKTGEARYMYGHLTQAANGKLYGLSAQGGAFNDGALFSFDPSNSSYETIRSFYFNDGHGRYPYGSLLIASDGKMWGTTSDRGAFGAGTIFSMDPSSNTYQKVFDLTFAGGSAPIGDLTFGPNGRIYGTTVGGGANNRGVIFSFNPQVVGLDYQVLKSLTDIDGFNPYAGLLFSQSGKLYGLSYSGGDYSGGVAFSFDVATSTYRKIYDFGNPLGIGVVGSLTKDEDGKFWGVTTSGGRTGNGIIYSFEPSTNSFTKVKDFEISSGYGSGSLITASDNKLYGMTAYGGNFSRGVIYSFDPATSQYKVLAHFNGTNGAQPQNSRLYQAADGKLYGMTYFGGTSDKGVIFSFDINSSTITKLKDFDGASGQYTFGDLVQANDGKLYGMTLQGGASNRGVLFSFDPATLNYTVIKDLNSAPFGSLIKGVDGILYGTTLYSVISYNTDLNIFSSANSFYTLTGNLFQASNGKIYGINNNSDGSIGFVFSYKPSDQTFTMLTGFNDNNGGNPRQGNQFIEAGACALPNVSISESTTICAGTTLNLIASGGNNYRWTGPNDFSSNQQNPTIANVNNSNSGVYQVKVWNEGDCSSYASTTITINPLPNTPTGTENQAVCGNDDPQQSLVAQATVPAGQTLVWYTTSTGGTALENTPSQIGPGTSTYYVAAENSTSCESSTRKKIVLTINEPHNYYADADKDGFGDLNQTTRDCAPPTGYVANSTDCDDTKASVHPGATEVCNGIDDNCDGNIDEGVKTTYYRDADGDGYGDNAVTIDDCSQPEGYVTNNTDPDDSRAIIFPGATEICDGYDNDGNGSIDDGVTNTYYHDADGDGFGDNASPVQACTAPLGYVTDNTDGDDANPYVFPGSTEVCNGIDDNHNGEIDEGVKSTFYKDGDGDGHGDANQPVEDCSAPSGYVSNNDDCNDTDASIYPNAKEICDGKDNNCNGDIDEDGINIWEEKAAAPFEPRFLSVVFTIGKKAYITTGLGASKYSDLWEYDMSSNSWTRKADFPGGPRNAAVGFSIGKMGYVGTGSDNSSTEHTKDFWQYDPSTNTWTQKADFPGNPRTVASGFAIGNKGYVGLGRAANFSVYYKDFYEYDPSSNTWTRKSDFGGDARYAAAGFVVGTKGYIGTGTAAPGFTYKDDLWEYNQSDDSWSQKANIPGGPRELASAFSIGQYGYMGTGFDGGLKGDFWQYSPQTNTWSKKADLAGGARDMAVGFSIGQYGFITTGRGAEAYRNDLWRYTGTLIYYRDADGDGFGNPNISTTGCTQPDGYVTNNDDCDDGNNAIAPGATEICDGIDNNCDGVIDEGCPARALNFDGINDYAQTGIPFNYQNFSIEVWVKPGTTQQQWADIMDNNHFLGANWVLQQYDNNTNTYYFAVNKLGGGWEETETFNLTPNVWHHVAVVKNTTSIIIYVDGVAVVTHALPAGLTVYYADPSITLGRLSFAEIRNWNGSLDEVRLWNRPLCQTEVQHYMNKELPYSSGSGLIAYYKLNAGIVNADNRTATRITDETGGHNGTIFNFALTGPTSNWVSGKATGTAQPFTGGTTWYRDADGDGFGTASNTINVCGQPQGYVSNSNDCNDNNAAINPNAAEVCDGIDNNCNGLIDEGVKPTFYRDRDGDGFGNYNDSLQACTRPTGYVANGTDCNDNNASIKPGAVEVCGDGIDNNCDGQIDENCNNKTVFSINSVTTYESQLKAVLTVTLSKKLTVTATVNYSSADGKGKGGATNPADYTAVSGTLTFAPGVQTATITVPIKTDNIVEPNETFTVSLSKPVNAAIGTATGTVTIINGGITSIVDPSTMIEELTVKVNPNPTNDRFRFYSQSADKQPLVIRVFDNLGRIVEVRSNVSPNSAIYFGERYRAGIYYVEVIQGDMRRHIKLIKGMN